MHVDASDEPVKVTRVLCDLNPLFVHTSLQDGVIEFAAPSHVERMERVEPEIVEAPRERW